MLIEKDKITVLPSDKIPEIKATFKHMPSSQRGKIEELDWQRGVMLQFAGRYFPNLKRLRSCARQIRSSCFSDCAKLERAELVGVKEIGAYAFVRCPLLKTVIISGGRLTVLDYGAFCYCPSLTEVSFPDGGGRYTSRDGGLFTDKGVLLWLSPLKVAGETLELPEGTTDVDAECLHELPVIKTLRLPASYTGDSLSNHMLYYLRDLERFVVHPDNKACYSENGLLYKKEGSVLLAVPPSYPQKHILIPHCVRVVYNAFCPHTEIESVTFAGAVVLDGAAFITKKIKSFRFCDNVKLETPHAVFCGNVETIEFDGDLIPCDDAPRLTLIDHGAQIGLILCSAKNADKIEDECCKEDLKIPKIIRL